MGNNLWPCSEVASSPTKVLMLSVLPLHLIIWVQVVIKSLKETFSWFFAALLCVSFEKCYCITAAKCITIEVGLEIQPHKFAFKLPKKPQYSALFYAYFSKELKVNSEKTKSQKSLNSLLFQPNSKWWWNPPLKVQTTGRCEIASLKKQHSAQSKIFMFIKHLCTTDVQSPWQCISQY